MVLVKAPVALTGPSVVLLSAVVGFGSGAPDDAMLGWIGNAQRGDVAVPRGCGGRMIFVTAWVVTVGTCVGRESDITRRTTVPAALVA